MHRGMMAPAMAGLALALAMTGCKKHDAVAVTNASPREVGEKVAAATNVRPNPGKWQARTRIEQFDLPNLPAETRGIMNAQLKAVHTSVSCLTPQEAAKPDASFFQDKAKGCVYDHFTMANGRIDAQMTCASGPQHQTMVMDGTYSPDSYAMTLTMKGEAQPGMPMTMKMAIDAKRIGACDGKG